MKVATYNVNGVNGRLPRLLEWLDETKPDIVCLQEIKTTDEKCPARVLADAGYAANPGKTTFSRIPGDVVDAGGGGVGCGWAAAGAIGTAGIDGLLMRPPELGGAAGAGVVARARGIVGMLSRPVSMLISPYSSSSMAAVGSEAAARPAAGGGAAGTPAGAPAGAPAPLRRTSRTLSIIAFVSHGLISWPSAPAF